MKQYKSKLKAYAKRAAAFMLSLILVLPICAADTGQKEALTKSMLALSKTQAGGDYADLLPLKEILNHKEMIAVGEATHGSKEFQQIKHRIFEFLVKETDIRVFAIEGDFGGAQVVNQYILGGEGTAEEAAASIGFAVYNTKEMAEMIKWMRQYNESAALSDKIHFYGFDMQRYDYSKAALFKYISKVDSPLTVKYEKQLEDLNDKTVYNQEKAKVTNALKNISAIKVSLEKNKKAYSKKSSDKEYTMALKYAEVIQQNAKLRLSGNSYSATRDAYMAKNIKWILGYEKLLGNNKLFISAHNGHVEKSSASSYHSMGNILKDEYGERYYAIGTEFYEAVFNCKDAASNQRKRFSIKSEGKNYLANQLEETGIDKGFIDFKTAKYDVKLKEIFEKPQMMHNIGDEFSKLLGLWDRGYMLQQVPAKAYDGLIFIKSATPTESLNGEIYPLA